MESQVATPPAVTKDVQSPDLLRIHWWSGPATSRENRHIISAAGLSASLGERDNLAATRYGGAIGAWRGWPGVAGRSLGRCCTLV
ncbi:MAG: hypothetical protein H0T49_04870 [Chloroflexia bacterium]|jgi:hypothetical protein|nr:hypothetical protein [Chloroflexia bacterium]